MKIHILFLIFLVCSCNGVSGVIKKAKYESFDVSYFGARGDGRTDDSKAFMAAWKAACEARGSVRLHIPKAIYLVGPMNFIGPCKDVSSITIYMKGHLKATKKLSEYGANGHWILFGWVDRLTLTGGGTFDGQGSSVWHLNNCSTNSSCILLPTSLKFVSMRNTIVKQIKSVDSKFFHITLLDCHNFWMGELSISAPEDSPNTDGIHIEGCTEVSIYESNIGTGDDCISIGPGSSQVLISGITCGPGHGISVGSLGRYPNEADVGGILVRNCKISETTNGLRIKTWADNPGSSAAYNITFENVNMKNVSNPIIIDQTYCPYPSCVSLVQTPSRVKIKDVSFKNIWGTSATEVAVTLQCSQRSPCQNIVLQDVHLDYSMAKSLPKSACSHARVNYSGTQIPPPCI